MADWYVDYISGDDTTGTGASGAPFQTIQKAFDSATYGDTVYLANTGDHIVTTSLGTSLTTANSAGSGNHLRILPWDNGGSFTLQTALGVVTSAKVTSTTDEVINTTCAYTSWSRIHLYGNSFSAVRGGTNNSFSDCRIESVGNGVIAFQNLGSNRCFRCVIVGSRAQSGSTGTASFVGCILRSNNSTTVTMGNNFNIFHNCIIHKTGSGGQLCDASGDTNMNIVGCIFIGDGSNTGILTNGGALTCVDCVFHNLSTGIDFNGTVGQVQNIGGNVFSSVTTDYSSVPVVNNDYRSLDSALSLSFTDPTNYDYSISGISGTTGAVGLFNGLFQSYVVPGAIQPASAGGGIPGIRGILTGGRL